MKNNRFLIVIVLMLFLNSSCAVSQTNLKNDKNFKVVGFHLDLRIQVMKLDALKEFVDQLSTFGVNTLIMEWEATFPFESHPLIANQLAYSKKEIKEFVDYCKKKNIEVVPLQQSLGHLEYVLRHQRYSELREDPKDVSQTCPMEPELNKALFVDLFTEMVALHPSKYFHIGGDEAYLFGQCKKCSARVKKDGKSTLLAEHLKMVTDIVVSLGKTPILWSDVANKYPDKLDMLPKETVFLVWNYGWALDRFGDPKKLTDKGFEVWGAPSLRSNPDNFYITNWEKHFNNIKDFIPQSYQSNYNGMIMTSWSTSGIYSPVYEDRQTIAELKPVRNVYPISGFKILLAAYAQSIQQKEGLDIEKFIINYGKKQFKFNKEESLKFWKALKGLPFEVIDGKVQKNKELNVKMLHDSVKNHQKIFYDLKPKKNITEFEHYKLMTDIRENYLAFKEVEVLINSSNFTSKDLKKALPQLKKILQKDEEIKIRFTKLNSNLLHSLEIEKENQIRIKRVQLLYDRLSKTK